MQASAPDATVVRIRRLTTQATQTLPGLGLTLAVGALAFGAARVFETAAVSPLIIALGIGAAMKNLLGIPANAAAGIRLSSRYVLRAGIVIVGMQLSIGQVVGIGGRGLTIIVGAVISTFLATVWMGPRFGVDSRLVQLVAAGTSICGASAIAATNTVTRADEEDVAYAVALVSLFGSVAVFLYPLAAHALKLNAQTYGLWSGVSIHEIGQVAAAVQSHQQAGAVAMAAKLSRVALLAPVVFLLAKIAERRCQADRGAARVETPWFLIGFFALMLMSSAGVVSTEQKASAALIASGLLTVALAGMGLDLDLRKLRARGCRPLMLGACASLFICLSSLICILSWR